MRLLNSFRYAIRGVLIAVQEQSNMKIHLAATIGIVGAGLYLNFNYVDWCITVVTIGAVIAVEVINTSIEELVSFVSPEKKRSGWTYKGFIGRSCFNYFFGSVDYWRDFNFLKTDWMKDYWVDTHAHIYSEEFDKDRPDMLARCEQVHVRKIYMPNIDHTSIDSMMELETKNPNCQSMMGLHPCSVKKDFEKELYLIESWLNKREFAAIGEMGTDLYWDKTFWEQQREAFEIQVGWARKFKKPIVIHCRESIDETIKMLEPLLDGTFTGVFHCFSGSLEQAKKIIAMGFYLGIGGVATFKNGGLDKILPQLDLNAIVLETDSPYLAPVPNRGKRNEPSYIPLIAQRVADVKGLSIDEVMTTSLSASRLFGNQKPTVGNI